MINFFFNFKFSCSKSLFIIFFFFNVLNLLLLKNKKYKDFYLIEIGHTLIFVYGPEWINGYFYFFSGDTVKQVPDITNFHEILIFESSSLLFPTQVGYATVIFVYYYILINSVLLHNSSNNIYPFFFLPYLCFDFSPPVSSHTSWLPRYFSFFQHAHIILA